MLKKGSTGEMVKAVQDVLGVESSKPYRYGDKTEQAVREYQKQHNLADDGVVGYKTLLSLAKSIKLTENFTLHEFIFSNTAVSSNISNMPTEGEYANIVRLAGTMQKVRDILGHPINVSSGFRSLALNRAVGGSTTSAHRFGLAADFKCPGYGGTRAIVAALSGTPGLMFDQVIAEFPDSGSTWVHLGLRSVKERRQVLTALKRNGKTYYVEGLH